jgi:hypothetical protein
MTRVWIICAALVLAGGLALPATAEEQSVAGNWAGTATGTTGSPEKFKMALMQNGQEVTGTYTVGTVTQMGRRGRKGNAETTDVAVKGTFAGSKLSLRIGEQGTLEATVNGDSMSGRTASPNAPPSDVSAKRSKY